MASDRFPTGGGWRGALVGDRCEVFSSGLLPGAVCHLFVKNNVQLHPTGARLAAEILAG
jgi:hypothetical protein